MGNREVKIDTEMVQQAPPVKVTTNYKPIMVNITKVREEADGEWWRIARFDTVSGGYNRAASLRKREGMDLLEFKGVTIDELEQPDDFKAGWRSQLHCRWIGAKGQPGHVAPTLKVHEGGANGDSAEDDGAPKKRGPGRPRKTAAPTS